jgi:hypothetical protein
MGVCGWALWRWSYIEDQNIPAFNLAKVSDGRIQPGDLFKSLSSVLKSVQ